MKIKVENYSIECFESERDYKNWFKDNVKEIKNFNIIYNGALYDISQNIRELFNENVIVSIKKSCYHEAQFIVIYK